MYGVALPQGFDGNKEDFAYCSSISIVVILYSGLWFLTVCALPLDLDLEAISFFLASVYFLFSAYSSIAFVAYCRPNTHL